MGCSRKLVGSVVSRLDRRQIAPKQDSASNTPVSKARCESSWGSFPDVSPEDKMAANAIQSAIRSHRWGNRTPCRARGEAVFCKGVAPHRRESVTARTRSPLRIATIVVCLDRWILHSSSVGDSLLWVLQRRVAAHCWAAPRPTPPRRRERYRGKLPFSLR